MIIDRARLAGKAAYLRDGTTIDLASGGGAHRGVSPELDDGMARSGNVNVAHELASRREPRRPCSDDDDVYHRKPPARR